MVLPIARRQCSRGRCRACAAQPAAHAGGGAPAPLLLVVYTKADCPLCQGLTTKLRALIDRASFLPSALSGAVLEERDIATNPAWAAAYDLSVPVLKAALGDGAAEVRGRYRRAPRVLLLLLRHPLGTDRRPPPAAPPPPTPSQAELPRPAPRLTNDGLQKHLDKALAALAAQQAQQAHQG